MWSSLASCRTHSWPRGAVADDRRPENPIAWLLTIAMRRGIDHFRRADNLRRETAKSEPARGGEKVAMPGLDRQVDDIATTSCASFWPVAPAPLADADYTYDTLPSAARAAVPTEAQLADAAGAVVDQLTTTPDCLPRPATPATAVRKRSRTATSPAAAWWCCAQGLRTGSPPGQVRARTFMPR